jgi:NADPH-dependent 2,4-dienoyl-CoA reductase/sulfur reductase-like enzyme
VTAERLACDIAVVGAGPAGMAAAETAARAGADVVMLDLFPGAGGQYHMQPPPRLTPQHASPQASAGREALRRCEEAGARLVGGAEVFWAEPGFKLLTRRGSEALRIDCRALVAATGAYERALPFKGWTLPGVIAAGAAQRLVKTAGTPPGKRVVLAGSGPFLLAVATTFAKSGLRLSAFVEAARPGPAALGLLARHPDRLGETAKLAWGVARTRPAYRFGALVTEALGTNRIEAVRIAPVTPDGAVQVSKAEVIEGIDALCVGYGFRPSVELTAVLKAAHAYDERLGGWFCKADPRTGATNVAGLYAAGEVTGVRGALPARLGGILAGFHCAASLGFRRNPVDRARLERRLARAGDFALRLASLYPLPAGLLDAAGPEDILCRCEDVSFGEVWRAMEEGADDAFSVKMWTRAGMGPCQGRMCGQAITCLLARRLGLPPEHIGFNRPHLPIRPVPLDLAERALAQIAPADLGSPGHGDDRRRP